MPKSEIHVASKARKKKVIKLAKVISEEERTFGQ